MLPRLNAIVITVDYYYQLLYYIMCNNNAPLGEFVHRNLLTCPAARLRHFALDFLAASRIGNLLYISCLNLFMLYYKRCRPWVLLYYTRFARFVFYWQSKGTLVVRRRRRRNTSKDGQSPFTLVSKKSRPLVYVYFNPQHIPCVHEIALTNNHLALLKYIRLCF